MTYGLGSQKNSTSCSPTLSSGQDPLVCTAHSARQLALPCTRIPLDIIYLAVKEKKSPNSNEKEEAMRRSAAGLRTSSKAPTKGSFSFKPPLFFLSPASRRPPPHHSIHSITIRSLYLPLPITFTLSMNTSPFFTLKSKICLSGAQDSNSKYPACISIFIYVGHLDRTCTSLLAPDTISNKP